MKRRLLAGLASSALAMMIAVPGLAQATGPGSGVGSSGPGQATPGLNGNSGSLGSGQVDRSNTQQAPGATAPGPTSGTMSETREGNEAKDTRGDRNWSWVGPAFIGMALIGAILWVRRRAAGPAPRERGTA